MALNIVNLSDIHFTKNDNPILEKREKLVNVIKAHTSCGDSLLFIVSGDIAYSGLSEEYEIAISFFNYLRSVFDEANFLFTAGNHDCDFSKHDEDQVREALMALAGSKIKERKNIDASVWNQILYVQKNYDDFLQLMKKGLTDVAKEKITPLLDVYKYRYGNDEILNINIFNTAWDSRINEQAGGMLMPINGVEKLSYDNSSTLNLSILHHPFHWLEPDNKRIFQEKVERISDWIITGHEHVETSSLLSDNNGISLISEADVLQDNCDAGNSGFNIFKVDTTIQGENEIEEINVHWDMKEQIYLVHSEDQRTFAKKNIIVGESSSGLEITSGFRDFLDELGTPIRRKHKEVKLDDVFVYPEVREQLTDKKNDKRIDSSKLLKRISAEDGIWFFSGAKERGKTTFLKKIFLYTIKEGMLPLIIQDKIKAADLQKIDKVFEKAFLKEYDGKSFEWFRQQENKIIMIDDWDQIDLNSNGKKRLIEELKDTFKIVVLMANEVPQNTADILAIRDDDETATDLHYFSLQQFGKFKREELIRRWVSLEKDVYRDSKLEVTKKVDKIQRQVSEIIGKSYVPQVPVYILVILQSMDKNSDLDGFKDQTNGYYYELLIKTALVQVGVSTDSSTTLYNYLTELAYLLFKDNQICFEYAYWNDFHLKYIDKYDLDVEQASFDLYKDLLEQSNIIKRNEDSSFTFSYSYIFYYFIAQYFANHIEEESMKEHIKMLIENVNIGMNADILIFLVHLSKNNFILHEVIETSNELLKSLPELQMQEDIGTLNELITEVPTLVVKSETIIQNRNKYNIGEDQLDDVRRTQVESAAEESQPETVKSPELVEMDKAYKISEIIGQILKDYSGTIDGKQKYDLLESAYNVSLRAGSQMVKIISDERDDLLSFVIEQLSKSKSFAKKDKTEVENTARKIVFDFCETVCYAIIQKIIRDTGTSSIKVTYEKVLDDGSMAKKLIVVGTYTETMYIHPQRGYALTLFNQAKSNSMAQNILQKMVGRFLYLFNLNGAERQQIADKFHISYSVAKRLRIEQENKD